MIRIGFLWNKPFELSHEDFKELSEGQIEWELRQCYLDQYPFDGSHNEVKV